jgi:hypothetical protein
LSPEVEEPDLRPADALRLELAAWDASADVRRDEVADAARLRDRRPAWADVVEKSAGRAPDVRELRALRHQSELQVALVEALDAPALYTPVVARFAERSCAARAAVEQLALPQPEALAEYSRKPQALLVKISPQPAEQKAALEERLLRMLWGPLQLLALQPAAE